MIEHKDITDPNIHEPKGAATAAVNRLYVADGAGSGSWKKLESPSLDGIDGDSSVVGKQLVSDGSNGFKFLANIPYGNMVITNNITNFSVTAVADPTFNTAEQFSVVTGSGAPWVGEHQEDIIFNVNKLTVPIKGLYRIDTYLNIGSFPSTTAKIAIRYLLNGTTYSARKPTVKSSGSGAEAQLIGFGILEMNANDYIQLTVASDTSGSLLIRDSNVVITLVKELPV